MAMLTGMPVPVSIMKMPASLVLASSRQYFQDCRAARVKREGSLQLIGAYLWGILDHAQHDLRLEERLCKLRILHQDLPSLQCVI